jgi:hypothetical protein
VYARLGRLASQRADISPRRVIGTVPSGPARARVDEHPRARCDSANAEPADAELRNGERDPDDGAGREPVRGAALRSQVHVPPLIVVTDHLRVNRELHEQRIELGHGRLIVAGGSRSEDGREFRPQIPEHSKIAPGDGAVQAVTKRAVARGGGTKRVQVIGTLDCRIGQPNR